MYVATVKRADYMKRVSIGLEVVLMAPSLSPIKALLRADFGARKCITLLEWPFYNCVTPLYVTLQGFPWSGQATQIDMRLLVYLSRPVEAEQSKVIASP